MDLFRKPAGAVSRWATFENPGGVKGGAATANKGGKGHPCENLAPGEMKTLLDLKGAGVLRRIWITIDRRSPDILRGLRIDMYWDGCKSPAVSAPVGDFFGVGLGRTAAFECEFFASPEARSFNCFIPMPFRSGARITVSHEGAGNILFFYEIDYTLGDRPDDALYFHSLWRRENPTQLGVDFPVLPAVQGMGRFLGCNIGVIADPGYGDTWWGEGEVKVFIDGDTKLPTMAGTGTEDYIGTGWGQGIYAHRFQGSTVADKERKQWAFYRYHVPDPIYFDKDCRVVLQQIGGAAKPTVMKLIKAGMPVKPVTVASGVNNGYVRLLDQNPVPALDDPSLTDFWCNFYRCDDVSAAAYFYLDRPENGLAALAPAAERIAGLADIDDRARADA